ncbi:hypothetical protein PRUB_a4033 [Pseudoalteromonas rubra]|uniref:Uncharacterized protein n=1 Tax=Pseudoalteromonas rubra TaxID=43658 RepID=A0A8T0CAR6_9GAMM|nr:hypothetical protein [Pseudoalteromonas rubra]KAF7787162.1 hypothetical protein PRUB_a4033 [Pseudoalteromonas rubra]
MNKVAKEKAMAAIAPESIAGYLNQCRCESFDDVNVALQHLIDAALETQQAYQNHPEALKAQTVPTIN